MADEDTSLPPLEIPWKLAATTQPLSVGEPAQTALSLFFFEPDDAVLIARFPDQKLVFIKLTASISPASFPPELSRVAAQFLGKAFPACICCSISGPAMPRATQTRFGPTFTRLRRSPDAWCRPESSEPTSTRARRTA